VLTAAGRVISRTHHVYNSIHNALTDRLLSQKAYKAIFVWLSSFELCRIEVFFGRYGKVVILFDGLDSGSTQLVQ